ncbi:hypothetical protein GCM10010994_04810 [Chelatococcus reniformis]|uniref:Uncharacterized protein n=1 Tax=Chelatococcus reniformis TaxID=1494448 RepID=A0A916X6X8_9HYPH|nr:hypothetical protein GCM10010994_04810 [Chelatococcus reniformis]
MLALPDLERIISSASAITRVVLTPPPFCRGVGLDLFRFGPAGLDRRLVPTPCAHPGDRDPFNSPAVNVRRTAVLKDDDVTCALPPGAQQGCVSFPFIDLRRRSDLRFPKI